MPLNNPDGDAKGCHISVLFFWGSVEVKTEFSGRRLMDSHLLVSFSLSFSGCDPRPEEKTGLTHLCFHPWYVAPISHLVKNLILINK